MKMQLKGNLASIRLRMRRIQKQGITLQFIRERNKNIKLQAEGLNKNRIINIGRPRKVNAKGKNKRRNNKFLPKLSPRTA